MNKVNLTRLLQYALTVLQIINGSGLFKTGSVVAGIIAAITGAIQIYIHEVGLKLPPGGIIQ